MGYALRTALKNNNYYYNMKKENPSVLTLARQFSNVNEVYLPKDLLKIFIFIQT